MAQTMTIEQAQAYLREHEFGKLRVLIRDPFYGERDATLCNGRTSAWWIGKLSTGGKKNGCRNMLAQGIGWHEAVRGLPYKVR